MKLLTILSALLLGAGLSFAGPDGTCKKGACKKGDKTSLIQVALDDDAEKPERRGPPEGKEGGKRRGPPGGPRGERGERPDPAEHFKTMDKDSSGGVSLAEMKAGRPAPEGVDADRLAKRNEMMAAMFAKLDADKSGEVSIEEMKNGRRGGPRGGARVPGGEKGERGGKDGGERPKRPPVGD